MKILILGDVMGSSGRKALSNKLPELIKTYKIDFVIVNGEPNMGLGRFKENFGASGIFRDTFQIIF